MKNKKYIIALSALSVSAIWGMDAQVDRNMSMLSLNMANYVVAVRRKVDEDQKELKKQGKLDVQSLSAKINTQLKDVAEEMRGVGDFVALGGILRYRDIYICLHPSISLPVNKVERYHVSKTALQIAVLEKQDESRSTLSIWKYVLDAELESGGKTVVQCAGSSKRWVKQVTKECARLISYMRFIGDDEKMLLLLSPSSDTVNAVVPGYRDYVYDVETGKLCNDVARGVITAGLDDSFNNRKVDFYQITMPEGGSRSMFLCRDQRNIDISASSLKVQDRATIEDIAGYLIKNSQ